MAERSCSFRWRKGDVVRLHNPFLAIWWIRESLAVNYGRDVQRWPDDVLSFLQAEADKIIRASVMGPLVIGCAYEHTCSAGIYTRRLEASPFDWSEEGFKTVVGHIPNCCYTSFP